MKTLKNIYSGIMQYIPYTRAWKARKRKIASDASQGSIIFSPNFVFN